MVDWKKKAAKQCGEWLQPGEEVLAATLAEPPGIVGRSVAFGAGGAVGLALNSRGSKKRAEEAESIGSDQGIADGLPTVKGLLVLTSDRFLIFTFAAIGTKPKKLAFKLARQDVDGATYEQGKLLGKMQLGFSDGSAARFEAARSGKLDVMAGMLGAVVA